MYFLEIEEVQGHIRRNYLISVVGMVKPIKRKLQLTDYQVSVYNVLYIYIYIYIYIYVV